MIAVMITLLNLLTGIVTAQGVDPVLARAFHKAAKPPHLSKYRYCNTYI